MSGRASIGRSRRENDPTDHKEPGEDQNQEPVLKGQLKDALEHVESFRRLLPLPLGELFLEELGFQREATCGHEIFIPSETFGDLNEVP